MGFALLSGWLAQEIAGRPPIVLEPSPSAELVRLASQGRVVLNPDPAPAAIDIAVVAVKPQTFSSVVPSIVPFIGPQTLVMSIAAGKTLADIGRAVGSSRPLARVMPNTPAAIGAGISVACAGPSVSDNSRALCTRLLEAVGAVEWIENEDQMDAVTALSGSGPAYVFYFAECLAAAGRDAGLDAALADRLARATVCGSGALLQARNEAPGLLRAEVTSPGGTTEAALNVLMHDRKFERLIREAIDAARRRAGALSQM